MVPVFRRVGLAVASAAAIVLMTGCGSFSANQPVKFETPYQAVLLSNGSVYFGKLQGWGTSQPILTEVYYVVSQTDPTTKAVKNVLVKRGKEWHAPDRMYLNPNQILFVEPVGKDSTVAQRIAEASVQ